MSLRKTVILSFVVTLLLWVILSWPLPAYIFSGIPAAADIHRTNIQATIPGDHLQFMYYCWLAGDMAVGNTPLFYNLYEFNTGDESSCYQPYAYYFPFSLLYAGLAWLGGRALGWNVTAFISLWFTCFFTWLLVRRYVQDNWVAGMCAALSIILPFRLINLFGGSPAGFSMMWVPAVFLGLDMAVRENRLSGGLLAGLAILFASWGDTHVFFFSILATPFWCVLGFVARKGFQWRKPFEYMKIVFALLPVALFAGLALLFPLLMRELAEQVTGLSSSVSLVQKRGLSEILIFSPVWRGLFSWNSLGMSDQIYIGYVVPVTLAAGGIVLLVDSVRRWKQQCRTMLVAVLLASAIVAVVILALGPRGPWHGSLFILCRRIIPPYAMIRQPAKIFCLLPSLLSVAVGIVLVPVVPLAKSVLRKKYFIVPVILALLVLAEYERRVNPTISLLENEQKAYQAVAEDAAVNNIIPRVLVIPLWPGDSHYSSVYQYYASLYRIRMLNGYTPFVKKDYFENIFRRLESMNQGAITDDQLDWLWRNKIRYILVHEDLFPEKVSPFPVTFTLRQLLEHPCIKLLKQDGRVWAFKIGPASAEEMVDCSLWDIIGSARRWEAESCSGKGGKPVADSNTCGKGYVAMDEAGAWISTGITGVPAAPDLRWLVRARGHGLLNTAVYVAGDVYQKCPVNVDSDEWIWLSLPIVDFKGYSVFSLKLELQQGKADVDTIILAAGTWKSPEPGETLEIPAACFFHAGYINRENDSVVLLKDYDPKSLVFYGPKLPLEKGRYKIELVVESNAPKLTLLGQFNIRGKHSDPIHWVPVVAGMYAGTEYVHDHNLPVYLEFLYPANADIEIRSVVFKRLE